MSRTERSEVAGAVSMIRFVVAMFVPKGEATMTELVNDPATAGLSVTVIWAKPPLTMLPRLNNTLDELVKVVP